MRLKLFAVALIFILTSFNFKTDLTPSKNAYAAVAEPDLAVKARLMEDQFSNLYNELTGISKPSYEIFHKALIGFINLKAQGKLSQKELLTVIDFTLPSYEKRLWVIDLNKKKVIFNNLVAHGRNTGNVMAENFSNVPNSNMSSIGFYTTANTYFGKHGLSLRLNGMEEEFNSTALERAIVMHGADYVSQNFIERYGRLGRSLGCPSLPSTIAKEVIETIAEKTCLFIYSPALDYDNKSPLLNEDNALAFFAANNFMI